MHPERFLYGRRKEPGARRLRAFPNCNSAVPEAVIKIVKIPLHYLDYR